MANNKDNFVEQLGQITLDGKAYAILSESYIQESQNSVYERYNVGIPQLTDLGLTQHVGDHSPFLVTGHHIFAPGTLLDSEGFSLDNNGLTVLKTSSHTAGIAGDKYVVLNNVTIQSKSKPIFMFGGKELVWNGTGWTDGTTTITFGFGEFQVVYIPPFIYLIKNGTLYYEIPLLDSTQNIKYSGGNLTLPTGQPIVIPSNITSLDIVKTNGVGEIVQGRDFQIEGETGKIKFLENSYAVNSAPYTVSYLYQKIYDAIVSPLTLSNNLSFALGYDNISSALVYNGAIEDILLPGRDYGMENSSFAVKLLQTGRYRPGNYAITYLAMVPERTTANKTVTGKKIALDQKRILSAVAYDPSFTQNDLTLGQDYEIQYEQGNIRFLRNTLSTLGKAYSIDYTKLTHPTVTQTLTGASTITLANKRITEFAIGRQTKRIFYAGKDFEVDKLGGKIRLGHEIRSQICSTFDLNYKKSTPELAKTKISIGPTAKTFDTDATKRVLKINGIYRVLKPYEDGLLWKPLNERQDYEYNAASGTFVFHVRKEDIGQPIWLRGQKFGYKSIVKESEWSSPYCPLPKNLNSESINVYAYSATPKNRQYTVKSVDEHRWGSNVSAASLLPLNRNGQNKVDILVDGLSKKYFIPIGSRISKIVPNTYFLAPEVPVRITFIFTYLDVPTSPTPIEIKDFNEQWKELATTKFFIEPTTVILTSALSTGQTIKTEAIFDYNSNHVWHWDRGAAPTTTKAHWRQQEIKTATVTQLVVYDTWTQITGYTEEDKKRILPNTITVTTPEKYIYKYSYGEDWNYDPSSGIIFFNRMTNTNNSLTKRIECLEQTWEYKYLKTRFDGTPLLLADFFPGSSADFPTVDFFESAESGQPSWGSYIDYWFYMNWSSHLVMLKVESDMDDRNSENLDRTPFWYNMASKTIQIDETVELPSQETAPGAQNGQEIYVSYVRGTTVDAVESALAISDGWINITGITGYKDIDLDSFSITTNSFWNYQEGRDYMLNKEEGIVTAIGATSIACATNTDPLKAIYNYELYTPITAETVTFTNYAWTALANKMIVPRSERIYFTISETYKGRKLYFKEGVDYSIDPESATMYVLDGGRIIEGQSVGLEIVNYELEQKNIASKALTYDLVQLVGDSEYWRPIPGSEIISQPPAKIMLMEENADYLLERSTGYIKRIENGRILTTDTLTCRLSYFDVSNHSQTLTSTNGTWQDLTYPKVSAQSVRAQYDPAHALHPDYSFVFQKDVDYSIEPDSGTLTATPFNRFTSADTISVSYQYLDLEEYLAKLVADGQTFTPVDSGIDCDQLITGTQTYGLHNGNVFGLQGKNSIEMINFGGTTVNGILYFYGQPLAYGHINTDNRQIGFITALTGEKLVVLDQELTTNSSVTAVCESGHMYFAAGTCIYEYMGNNGYRKLYNHGAVIDDMRFINNKLYYISNSDLYLLEGGVTYSEASFITGSLNAGYRNVNKLFRKAKIEFDSHPTGTLIIQAFEDYKRLKEGAAHNYTDTWAYELPAGTWDGNYYKADIPDKFLGTDFYLRFKYTRPAGQNGSSFSIKGYDVEFLPCGELKLSWRVTVRATLGVKFRDQRVETRTPKEILDQLNVLADTKTPIKFKSLHNEEYDVRVDKITNEGAPSQTSTGESLITLVLMQI